MKQIRSNRCNMANKGFCVGKRKQYRVKADREQRKSLRDENFRRERTRQDVPNSWMKFFSLTLGLNLVQIFSLKCNLNVNYPVHLNLSRLLLRLPYLCQKTVTTTARFVYQPFHYVSINYCPDLQTLRIIGANRKYWKSKLPNVWTTDGRASKVVKTAKRVIRIRLSRATFATILKALRRPSFLAKQFLWKSKNRSYELSLNGTSGLTWQVRCYCMMPLKSLSSAWGFIHNLYLPVFLRPLLLIWYVKFFRCDLSEAEKEDLKSYKNLGELFRRNLKDGVRPIHTASPVVSPADGTILHFGKVERGLIEQVKGITYSIAQFLGPQSWREKCLDNVDSFQDCERYMEALKCHNSGTSLFHCVIYLAPGDYHKFHSPADWMSKFRRHFAGELLSVNPTIARFVSGLFSLNERAVYVGTWDHGFFSLTAVGATNVGSISVYNDSELETNKRKHKKGQTNDKVFIQPLQMTKGEKIGEFNLGSTIVLIFEAPDNFKLNVSQGQHVKVGQSLT